MLDKIVLILSNPPMWALIALALANEIAELILEVTT